MSERDSGLQRTGLGRRSVGRRQEDLRARLFWAVFGEALDGMAVADDSHAFRALNRAAAELFGAELDDLIGRSLLDFVSDRAAAEAAWSRLLDEGSLTGEWTVARADGSEREVEFTARANVVPGRHLAVLHDVTERKAEARALRASEQRLRTIAESLEEGLVLVRFDGTLEWANTRFYELVGYEPGELLGRDAVSLLGTPEQQPTTRERIARRRTGVTERYEADLVPKDGSVRTVRITATPILDDAGQPVASLGALVDLTEERRLEAERRELELELEQAQTMAALGRLAGGIAHDFNNVMTVVGGNAELLCGTDDSPAPELEEILTAVRHAQGLTQRLLALAGKRCLAAEALSLNEVVQEFEPMLRTAAGSAVVLRIELDPGAGAVLAERTQLEQILLNLVLNARDAMPASGRLTVETGAADDLTGARAFLRVSDTGIGMDEATMKHAFEPFFTTKPGRGSGLGLSVVYGAVQQLGGRVTVTSKPGAGTTFHVVLPRSDVLPALARPSEPASRDGAGTVLVVDDNDGIRGVVRRVLLGAGYRVIEAASAAEAERVIRSGDPPVDLLLADVVMSGLDGFELADITRYVDPRIRIVHMSGYAPRAVQERPELRGRFLAKPFTADALLDCVEQTLAERPWTSAPNGAGS